MRDNFLVWSNEHGAWRRPGHQGYTRIIADAGRYTLAEAERICRDANLHQPAGEQPNEVLVLAPEHVIRGG